MISLVSMNPKNKMSQVLTLEGSYDLAPALDRIHVFIQLIQGICSPLFLFCFTHYVWQKVEKKKPMLLNKKVQLFEWQTRSGKNYRLSKKTKKALREHRPPRGPLNLLTPSPCCYVILTFSTFPIKCLNDTLGGVHAVAVLFRQREEITLLFICSNRSGAAVRG